MRDDSSDQARNGLGNVPRSIALAGAIAAISRGGKKQRAESKAGF